MEYLQENVYVPSETLESVQKVLLPQYEIAKLEYTKKKIPLIIKRRLPDNTFEYWKLEDLVLI